MTNTDSITRRALTAAVSMIVALSFGAAAYLTTAGSADSEAASRSRKLAGRKLSNSAPAAAQHGKATEQHGKDVGRERRGLPLGDGSS